MIDIEKRVKDFNFKMWFKQDWKVIAFLFLLVSLAYANSLNNGFVSDDISAILKNDKIDTMGYVFSNPITFLRQLLYFIIANLFGKAPIYYRLLNIFFHLGTVLITYFLIGFLTERRIALFTSSILAVHPLQVEAVTWISGGTYVQYSFFLILAFTVYILSIGNKKLFILSIFSFIFSLVSGEKAMVFPLILLISIISFGDMRKDYKKIIPFFIIGIIWIVIYITQIGQRITELQTNYYAQAQILNPFIQIPIAITSYLELIFWPKGLTLYHSEMVFSQLQYVIRLAISIVFLIIIAYSYRKNRSIFFGLSFFIISLLPVLTPLGISWIVAERYVYFGAIGVYLAAAIVINKLTKIRKLGVFVMLCFFLIIIALMIRTIYRNIDWKNEDNLWFATAKASPSSPNTHNNLGDVYFRRGDLEKAVSEFKKATEINPNYADAYHNLANTYNQMGNQDEAVKNYQNAVRFNSNIWQSYFNLGVIYMQKKDFGLAEENLNKAIGLNPKDSNLYYVLGVLYVAARDKVKAKEEFQKALDINPHNQMAKKGIELISQ